MRFQGKAGRIVRDKRLGWEYLLLSELMDEEIRLAKCQQVACSGGVEGRFRGANAAASWVRNLLDELEHACSTQSWDDLSVLLATALGRPGEPGDPEAIASAVHKLGVAYGAMLRYRDRLRTVRLDTEFDPLLGLVLGAVNGLIGQFDEWCDKLSDIPGVVAAAREGHPQTLEVVLRLNLPETFVPELQSEFARLATIARLF